MIPRYQLPDVVFTSLSDDFERHDITFDGTTRVTTILPRLPDVKTPKDRLVKRLAEVTRLDLTDRPTSFVSATTGIPDRKSRGVAPSDLSRSPHAILVALRHLRRLQKGQ